MSTTFSTILKPVHTASSSISHNQGFGFDLTTHHQESLLDVTGLLRLEFYCITHELLFANLTSESLRTYSILVTLGLVRLSMAVMRCKRDLRAKARLSWTSLNRCYIGSRSRSIILSHSSHRDTSPCYHPQIHAWYELQQPWFALRPPAFAICSLPAR